MTVVKSNCLKVSKAPESFSGIQWSDLEAAASASLSIWKALGACVSVAVSVTVGVMMKRFSEAKVQLIFRMKGGERGLSPSLYPSPRS